ncbi:MAG: DUF58 domain-containing protein [Phycisphaerae bacterium]|nr:DUF58 domain-containing protein [Tepidisphaeraceae bacterium]
MSELIDPALPKTTNRFLDLKALGALAHMRFVTRQQIEGAYSGRHRSRQQGGAAEFADYREYVEGEDLRRLDWKVLARTGRAYIRLFQDETNLSCTMVLDASASMTFAGTRRGGQSKLEYAQWLSTALAHVISRQQDQVGLAVVSDALTDFLPPGGRRTHVQGVQEAIERLTSRPATDLAAGLRQLFDRQTTRGVLLVMSDFLVDDLERVFAALRLFRHRHWEVILLHLVHPEEERLPEGQAFRFEGMENDGRIDASPADVRRLYEEQFEKHCAVVRDSALAANCDYRRVSTAVPYLRTLGGFLVERSG